MAFEGTPILDHKPTLVWENNSGTPLAAASLSKSTDLKVSYLDFNYNDPTDPLHREGTILVADPTSVNPAQIVMKRGVVFSIINQKDTISSPNDEYKIFDSGLDDLWITPANKDSVSASISGWGVSKQWFIFICDERVNNPVTKQNTAQIIVSQSNNTPQLTKIPGTNDFYSALDTRLIGGFKSNSIGSIIKESVWDIAGKFHTVKAKQYMILDEYSTTEGQHLYRKLRVSDLDSAGLSSIIGGGLLVTGDTQLGGDLLAKKDTEIIGNLKANDITVNGDYISIKDRTLVEYRLESDQNEIIKPGMVLRALEQPLTGSALFSVRTQNQADILRVEYDGKISTTNNVLSLNGLTLTNTLGTPVIGGTDKLVVNGHVYATKVYNAVWNDLAEFFLSVDPVVPGKVYVLHNDGKVKIANKKCDGKVIGVCSDTPAFIMKQEYEDKGGVPIAMSGTVNVWVNSIIKEGDELVSDFDGFARRASFIEKIFMRDSIFGKALQSSFDRNEKRVLMLVR